MKIRYITSWADIHGAAGDPSMGVVDIPEVAARDFIKRGWAEPVVPPKCPHCGKALDDVVLETATATAGVETATLNRGGRR